jgi:uncharacterized protein DUF6113
VRRPLAAVALLVLGLVTGLAGVAVHERWWGLALLVAATAAALAGLPPGWWSRLPFALGVAAQVGWLVAPRPEGDYAISQDGPGYVLLAFTLVVLVAGIATLPRPPARDRRVRRGGTVPAP